MLFGDGKNKSIVILPRNAVHRFIFPSNRAASVSIIIPKAARR